MDHNIENLIGILKKQAEVFLEDADEFYPFGAAFNRAGDVRPMGVFLENDHPQSVEVSGLLEKAIDQGLSNGDYEVAAICLDVFLSSGNNKISAMEVRMFRKGIRVKKCYIHYYKKKGEYFFEDIDV
ncbi:hypothetical protein [Chitinophaga sp. XS-30]|uniref:hypothetical protein n=1 Tax=Chitinophaga sp. XS-30 TaxID=2604421 RepID=UPI0011DD4982|nr:hypothetical protein [Chitinophaga sp. XS-30]QEH41137.1 hypothetical protein FW415_09725 [Chitinophaga sp. XS-30]